jgi:hypothetical protein
MADKRITSRSKVYITRIGLTDWLVAVDSQKAALKAWDVHRNLFAEGAARVTNDPAHVALAMRAPGVAVAAPGRIVLPEGDGPAKPTRKAKPPAAVASAPPPAKPDRRRIETAERDLPEFERDAARTRAEIERRLRAVENELAAFDAESGRRRIRLLARIKREREA